APDAREAGPAPGRGPARHHHLLLGGRGADAGAGWGRDPEHVVGPGPQRHGRARGATVRGRQGRGRGVQQEPGAQRRARGAGQRSRAGLDRDGVRRRARRRRAAAHRRDDAAAPVGRAGRRRAGRALPRLSRRGLPHRRRAARGRRRRHVAEPEPEGPMARPKLPTYTEEEVRAKLEAELPGWYYEDGWIRRQYKTDGWQSTLMLVNTIGYLAEAAYHHPDLTVTWAK